MEHSFLCIYCHGIVLDVCVGLFDYYFLLFNTDFSCEGGQTTFIALRKSTIPMFVPFKRLNTSPQGINVTQT